MIRYSTQHIDDDDIKAVVEALRSDFLTQGPCIERFEEVITKYVESKFSISVNSATSALHLACLALGVGKKSLVWTSPNSFVASSNCALYCGAKVDFVDIDPETYNMSPEALEKKLKTSRKKPDVVIVVHFAGQSCDMKKIGALSKKYKFKIIEDASHALGGEYNGRKIGSCEFSSVSVLSFHPVKMITTAEGGMLTTNDEKLARVLKTLRSHGLIRKPEFLKHKSHGDWYYEQQSLGYNYRMTEIQAALGISQMNKLDLFVKRRREIAHIYAQELQGLPLQLPKEIDGSLMSYHLYVIRLKKHANERAKIFKALIEHGIGVQVHYIPIYRQPYYEKMKFSPKKFPHMEKYYKEALSIPDHPKLSEKDQQFVVDTLRKILS
ncbi:MAG: UDP-4-amino-4,6-dideoxy-N-acetyl-beta-L-altrosamine transaminase [Bdellovibrionota bacterium]